MSETANIAKIAEFVATKLFHTFRWKLTGTMNHNWSCEKQDIHRRRTHPTDVAFYYDEPYSLYRTYVNCDLKSYARESINAGAIISAITELSKSLTCAEISETWRDMYVDREVNASIVGLLFVYNHDGEYDKNFESILSSIKEDELSIPKGSRIAVLGPKQIHWLDNVHHDIVYMRGSNKLPGEHECRFYYPELVRKKVVQRGQATAATLEMVTGPWITLEYGTRGTNQFGYVIYYQRRGEVVEEFLYLIDYIMHYQMLSSGTRITLKFLDAHPNAPALFQRAIHQYTDDYEGGEEMAGLLSQIQYEPITNVVSRFSTVQLGMFRA